MKRGVRTSGTRDGGTWLFVLIVLLTLMPSACVLWFMNEALATESAAAAQRVHDAYRGQLRLVRSRLDGVWRGQAARLDVSGPPEQHFARLIADEIAEGAVVLDVDGTVTYPQRQLVRDATLVDVERRVDAIAHLSARARDAAVTSVAARLNDYSSPLAPAGRLELMDRLRLVAPNVWLHTQAALHLSMDFLDAERPSPVHSVVRQTALHDVWALTSNDGRVVGLYRTGRVEAIMHDALHAISPAGIVFIAYPPDVRADAEAIAAGTWLPGWQLSYVPLEPSPFDDVAARRRTAYLSVAIAGIGLIAIAGVLVGGGLRRHLRVARLKTDLVAAVSHEMRTPLASMRVLVDGLRADVVLDPVKTREYLDLLAVESSRLTRLIDSFLTFSRLDRGNDRTHLALVSPSDVVSSALDAIRERVPPTGEVHTDIERELPLVRADRDSLSTALVNLLDNAIKYSPAAPRIEVRVRRDGSFISFAVTDNGIGIAPREQRRIFKRFYRVDQRLARDTSGVGLGLSIVELIARRHGGRVQVASDLGKGSTFEVRIPVPKTKGAA
jgi:signal transduction histidine kinase